MGPCFYFRLVVGIDMGETNETIFHIGLRIQDWKLANGQLLFDNQLKDCHSY